MSYLAAPCIVISCIFMLFENRLDWVDWVESLKGYRLFMNVKLLLAKNYLVQFDMPELEFRVILNVI